MVAPVELRLYAQAREAVGARRLARPIDRSGVPLAALVEGLVAEFPRLRPVLRTARFAVNGTYVALERTLVRPGDEVAIHPPYSGG